MTTEAQKRARNNYRSKGKQIGLQFNEHEKDLLDYLETKPSKQGYIKDLIRQDMEKERKNVE